MEQAARSPTATAAAFGAVQLQLSYIWSGDYPSSVSEVSRDLQGLEVRQRSRAHAAHALHTHVHALWYTLVQPFRESLEILLLMLPGNCIGGFGREVVKEGGWEVT